MIHLISLEQAKTVKFVSTQVHVWYDKLSYLWYGMIIHHTKTTKTATYYFPSTFSFILAEPRGTL